MTSEQIVRAWKDADYSASLSTSESSVVPTNPAGTIDLSDSALGDVAGGDMLMATEWLESLGCCQGITQKGYCDFTNGWLFCSQWCFTIFLPVT